MINLGKHNILGLLIDAIDYDAAVNTIMEAAGAKRSLAVSALAVHGVMTGVLDTTHRFRLNCHDLLLPDGQPVRWALNWLHGLCLCDRVYGPHLMLDVCQQAAKEKVSVFLYGSTDTVLNDLQRNLLDRFPELRIAGAQSSRFGRVAPAEKEEIIEHIVRSGAAITFVGLGCPRQEVWVYEHRQHLSMPLISVGAAFDFHAGRLSQAPKKMQRHGLEWLYRLSKEPGRLWKRYIFLNPLYLSLLFFQRIQLHRFDPYGGTPPQSEQRYG